MESLSRPEVQRIVNNLMAFFGGSGLFLDRRKGGLGVAKLAASLECTSSNPGAPARHFGDYDPKGVSAKYRRFLRRIRRIFAPDIVSGFQKTEKLGRIPPSSPDKGAHTPV